MDSNEASEVSDVGREEAQGLHDKYVVHLIQQFSISLEYLKSIRAILLDEIEMQGDVRVEELEGLLLLRLAELLSPSAQEALWAQLEHFLH